MRSRRLPLRPRGLDRLRGGVRLRPREPGRFPDLQLLLPGEPSPRLGPEALLQERLARDELLHVRQGGPGALPSDQLILFHHGDLLSRILVPSVDLVHAGRGPAARAGRHAITDALTAVRSPLGTAGLPLAPVEEPTSRHPYDDHHHADGDDLQPYMRYPSPTFSIRMELLLSQPSSLTKAIAPPTRGLPASVTDGSFFRPRRPEGRPPVPPARTGGCFPAPTGTGSR